jgi:succinylglutamate desuccinylase
MKHLLFTARPVMQLLKLMSVGISILGPKTVFLQEGIHGIELTGIPVVHEFMKGIEEHQLVYNTEYGVFQM